MKKYLLIASLLIPLSLFCQQRPQYTQYVNNYFLINPAFAGIEKEVEIIAGYRKQWAGLGGSPSTSYLTAHAGLTNELTDRESTALFSLSHPHHALGLTVINDEAGALNRFVCYGTYAYHLKLGVKMNMSAGISAGVSQVKVSQNKLELDMPVDPAVYNFTGRARADINAGILFYGDNFFAGISLQQIIPPDVISNGYKISVYGDRKFPDLFASAGGKFKINDDFFLTPSLMLKYINNLPFTFDINTKIDYKNLLWAGYSYRYKSGMAAMAGIRLKEGLKFGYSYDITTSGLQTVSHGTHEFLISFTIKRKNN